ncbi:MAG: Gfo/Idh/MocA family oxidoreductase [Candidatus Levybacteria bacterium]|nr:Gfo/Idh/MocA family oxidoreductase [Candidatus Levybacteria bacterium]
MTNLALIGLGRWGKRYISAIETIPEVQIKYICANSTKSLALFSDKYIKLDNYKDFKKYKDIDGVLVVTPAVSHLPIVKELLINKFNLLVEKPLVSSYGEALELVKIYEQNNKKCFMVGHTYLYNQAFLKVLELKKQIGDIIYIDSQGGSYGPFRDDVSALWDWAPHDISMILEIMQEDPIGVSAWSVNSMKKQNFLGNIIYVRLMFKNGLCAFMKIGSLFPVKTRTLTIVGLKSSVLFDDTKIRKVTLSKNDINGSETFSKFKNIQPLTQEVLEFIHCINFNKKPTSDFYFGIRIVKIISYIEESIRLNGKLIKIEKL